MYIYTYIYQCITPAHTIYQAAVPWCLGESVDDCGGGYSESIAEMCDELQNGSVALLMETPNGRDESGSSRDCYMLNPTLHSHVSQNMFRFLGQSRFSDHIIVRCRYLAITLSSLSGCESINGSQTDRYISIVVTNI